MEIASKWRFYLVFFSFLGITSELFDEFAYWFLNYQPSFYYRTVIPLSILFHSTLFPYISFQILFLWILFLMWAIYTYHCLYHFSLNVLLYVWLMYRFSAMYIYVFICIYVDLSIYLLKVGDYRPDGANVICFTMYRLKIKFSYSYSYSSQEVPLNWICRICPQITLSKLFQYLTGADDFNNIFGLHKADENGKSQSRNILIACSWSDHVWVHCLLNVGRDPVIKRPTRWGISFHQALQGL